MNGKNTVKLKKNIKEQLKKISSLGLKGWVGSKQGFFKVGLVECILALKISIFFINIELNNKKELF